MRLALLNLLTIFLLLPTNACREGLRDDQPVVAEHLRDRAERLARELILVDTHIDAPYRLREKRQDISVRTSSGDFDYPRARQGGLDVAFMSIYVPARYQSGDAKAFADELIAMVTGFGFAWPDKFLLVTQVEEVRRNFGSEKIALAMGMENGAPIEGNLENLRHFYNRGVRYITLTHSKSNHICDSSYDGKRRWNGLSPFGRQVIAEMNRLGMIIDVSHLSDEAFSQIMELSRAPVIASHSSCRHFNTGLGTQYE